MHCTDTRGSGRSKLDALGAYARASSNNDASDDSNALGPPADTCHYPFNQIQAFWQVDADSVRIGVLRAQSSLLDDNRRSGVNGYMARMAYEGEFISVSILAMDNVALNGNAMFSVLRNACGQSATASPADDDDDDGGEPRGGCGRDLAMPSVIVPRALPLAWTVVLVALSSALALTASATVFRAHRLRDRGPQEHRLVCNGHLV
jgi:hypothetical protein